MYLSEVIGMKTKFMIIIICIILAVSVFSGCFGENKTSSKKSSLSQFIGNWYGWSHYPNFYENWTFYENNSLKINDLFSIEWGRYSVNGNTLKVSTPLIGFDGEYIDNEYSYSFSEGNLHLSLINEYFEEDTAEFFKEGYRGEFYQKVSSFIGKWSNQTYENYVDYGEWIRYRNYTFYPNFTVKLEYNWYTSEGNEWHTFLSDFRLDDENNNWICIGTSCSSYNFSEDKSIFIYEGSNYYKVD